MWLYILLTLSVTLLGLLIQDNYITFGKVNPHVYRCYAPNRLRVADPRSRQAALNKIVSVAIFLLLFGVSALRVAVGNDYWPYRFNFLLIAADRTVSSEIGFNLIVKFMQWLCGLDNYIAIFALFAFITALYYVKAIYDLSEWAWLSYFLLLTNGFYFSSFTSVRYYLALSVALFSLKYVMKGKPLQFIVSIFLAAVLFHKSVLLVIPSYYLAKIKYKKWHLIPLGLLCGSFWVFSGFYRKLVFLFYPFYENSAYDDNKISYINIFKALAVLVLCLIYYKPAIKDNIKNKILFNLNIMALIVFSCLWFIPETTRVGYYFSATNIFLIPAVLIRIPNRRQKIFFTAVVVLAYAGYFAMYLKTCYEISIRLLPYMTWLFI